MDIFTKYNRNKIQDRQLDTLIGLSKGITADGRVDQAEAEDLAKRLSCDYMETSAKTGKNVELAFEKIARACLADIIEL